MLSEFLLVISFLALAKPQTRAQNWRGLEHLLKAFAERFEQRDPKTPARSGRGLGIGTTLSGNRKSALLLPNWFEDATEYRLKKALVRRRRTPDLGCDRSGLVSSKYVVVGFGGSGGGSGCGVGAGFAVLIG